MNLFGVEEVATSKSVSAPGWAYVPDTGVNASVSALQPTSRKRAVRTGGNPSGHDTIARQDAKIMRDLVELDKESYRDVSIPVPVKHRDNAGRASHGKVTPNVRKILQSQKTFANHLSDAEALAALAATQPTTQTSHNQGSGATGSGSAAAASSLLAAARRSHKKKDAPGAATKKGSSAAVAANGSRAGTPGGGGGGGSDGAHRGVKREHDGAPLPAPGSVAADPGQGSLVRLAASGNAPAAHPADADPLLRSRVPAMPAAAELDALVSTPPLTYQEARARLSPAPAGEEEKKGGRAGPGGRKFCLICGYWGRVKCTRCGGRVCALECLRTHQEECFMRYGA